MKHITMNTNLATKVRSMKGFTLLELLFVISVMGILSSQILPWVHGLLIEGRVEPSSKDIIGITNTLVASGSASGSALPYANLGSGSVATAAFANAGRGKATSLSIAGVGSSATVQHQLGLPGSNMSVSVAGNPSTGDSYEVTMPTVSKAACPGLATAINRNAEMIVINGVVVKPLSGTYNGTAAQNACTDGYNNTYVFTFR